MINTPHTKELYEKNEKDFYSKSISSQILLIPEVIKVDPILITVVEEKQDYLKNLALCWINSAKILL